MTTRKTAPAEEPKPALNIYQKLHLAKQSMGKVIKNATNPHLKRNYADINSIIDTVELSAIVTGKQIGRAHV